MALKKAGDLETIVGLGVFFEFLDSSSFSFGVREKGRACEEGPARYEIVGDEISGSGE